MTKDITPMGKPTPTEAALVKARVYADQIRAGAGKTTARIRAILANAAVEKKSNK